MATTAAAQVLAGFTVLEGAMELSDAQQHWQFCCGCMGAG